MIWFQLRAWIMVSMRYDPAVSSRFGLGHDDYTRRCL